MPQKEAIIFIDGNNFYHNVKSIGVRPSKVDFPRVIENVCKKFNLKKKDVHYYNSIPNIKTIGEENYYKHMSFLSGLEKSGIKVHKRKLQHLSNIELITKKVNQLQTLKICDNCKPIVTQNCIDCVGAFQEKEKGIDVMIVVDMIEMSLKDEYDVGILISGDADFIPALNLIKKSWKRVIIVASTSAGFSRDLRQTQKHTYLDEIILSTLKK